MTASDIEAAVSAAGLTTLPGGAGEQFAAYLALLLKWNAKLNLTAIREPAEIVRRQFIECIQCAQVLPEVVTLLDFGSGAGFPGIPIAIIRPEIDVVLGESQGKKAAFLREAVRTLGLGAEVFARRIETMGPDRVFDAVTLRAVDKMDLACRSAIDRVRRGGVLGVFATRATEGSIRRSMAGVAWRPALAISGLESGLLLVGTKE